MALDSWSAACNCAWEAVRAHSAREVKVSASAPSYKDLLTELQRMRAEAESQRSSEVTALGELRSQLEAALKELAEAKAASAEAAAGKKDLEAKEAALADAERRLEAAMKTIEELKAKLAEKPAPAVVPEKKGGCC